MTDETEHEPDDRYEDPIETAVFLAVLVAGFLAIHFGVARIW